MIIGLLIEIAGMFFLPLIVVLAAIYLGYLLGNRIIRNYPGLPKTAIGTVVGVVLSLLTFMVAFTFQIASNHYDSRKTLILKEIADIRTAWLRSELLKEPYRSHVRKLLTEYVDLWAGPLREQTDASVSITRSQKILSSLWQQVGTMPENDRRTYEYSLYSSSIISLIESFYKRITLFVEIRIPFAVLLVLYTGSFLAMMALGFQIGLSGKEGYWVSIVLAIIFALVIFLIIALDHPETQLVKVNLNSIKTLQSQMHALQEQKAYPF